MPNATMTMSVECVTNEQTAGPSRSSQIGHLNEFDATEDISLESHLSNQSCSKKRRRLPMQLRIPLHDFWALRRLRRQRRKSLKSQSSIDGKELSECAADGDNFEDLSGCATNANISTDDGILTCPVCITEKPVKAFPKLIMCDHRCCSDCLQSYIITEIYDSRVNISCPECPRMIHPNDIRLILDDDRLLEKYEIFMLRRHLTCEPDTR